MNRDGFRSGRSAAEHEAVHAVAAYLSGLSAGEVTIAPSLTDRSQALAGLVVVSTRSMPTPRTGTALIDTAAAPMAWERRRDRSGATYLAARNAARFDMEPYDRAAFLAAADRMVPLLLEENVAAAILAVADLLETRKSGSIFGSTVERLLFRRGLVPALDQSWRAA